jgi:hypothetical protein
VVVGETVLHDQLALALVELDRQAFVRADTFPARRGRPRVQDELEHSADLSLDLRRQRAALPAGARSTLAGQTEGAP